MYSEVLDLIASYECGLAAMIKDQSEQLGRKLNNWEMSNLFSSFETLPLWKPLIVRARTKMASQDILFFRWKQKNSYNSNGYVFVKKWVYGSCKCVFQRDGEYQLSCGAGHIDEKLLRRILEAILNYTYDELKLHIFNAISVDEEYY